jgi:hypothetical protein
LTPSLKFDALAFDFSHWSITTACGVVAHSIIKPNDVDFDQQLSSHPGNVRDSVYTRNELCNTRFTNTRLHHQRSSVGPMPVRQPDQFNPLITHCPFDAIAILQNAPLPQQQQQLLLLLLQKLRRR